MAGSRRFPPADAASTRAAPGAAGFADRRADAAVHAAVAQALARSLPQGGRVAVALSGGRDSVVLLDAAANVAGSAGCDVVALHVHHGLSPNADEWSRFCREACASRGITFAMRRVQVARGARVSIEAAARTQRYRALDALAHELGATAVLLAHHADDQAETMLLQLLRGGGPRGLAAMPVAREEHGLRWVRPLLGLPRAALEDYAARHALRYVDDESNADPKHRRNAIRACVVPALRAIAPGYPAALVRAAEHQAEAAALLDDLAALDAQQTCDVATLDLRALRALHPRRARNLLRYFLRRRGLPAPSAARLAEMLRQLRDGAPDARTSIAHAGAELGVHRDRLVVHAPAPPAFACEWTGAATVELTHGTLTFRATRGGGIAARHLAASRVTIRSGIAGERLRPAGRASRRPVADLLREAGVPQWDRLALPRLYCGESLAAVVPLGVDAAFAAASEEPAFILAWRPHQG